MSKILFKIFPLVDHLYIFQLLEYNSKDFFKWFWKYPLNRLLQRKHSITITPKALILLLLSIVLIIILSFVLSFTVFKNLALIPLLFIIFLQLSPLFLISANFFYKPFDIWIKNKIISKSIKKIQSYKNIKTIAVVGSFAKTSTKNMLYTLLWKDFYTVKTPKSFNTPISIAQTILDYLKSNTDIFICEMDAYHPKEIEYLCNLVKPSLGIITAIGPQHLERFGSMESLAKTQFELADYLSKINGVLFINSSDEWSMKLVHLYKNLEVVYFGFRKEDDIYATDIKKEVGKTCFLLKTKDGEVEIELPLIGEHYIVNFLAASAVAHRLGMSLEAIKKRAKLILSTPHRTEIITKGNITLIDNTYNTNPISSIASLNLLKNYPGNQKIVITPGFVELGREFSIENQRFAERAAKIVDQFIIVGKNARQDLMAGLRKSKFPKNKIYVVDTLQEGMDILSRIVKGKAVVLLENDLPDQYF